MTHEGLRAFCLASPTGQLRREQQPSILDSACPPRDRPSKSPKRNVHPREWRRPTMTSSALPIRDGSPARACTLQGVGRREASIDHVHIDKSCEYFKAELGKNRRVLRLILGAVDNDLSAEHVFPR